MTLLVIMVMIFIPKVTAINVFANATMDSKMKFVQYTAVGSGENFSGFVRVSMAMKTQVN